MKHRLSLLILLFVVFASCDRKHEVVYRSEEPISSGYYVTNFLPHLPRSGLTFIPLVSYQQTTEYTCGPASVITLLRYYGREGDEMTIAEEMGTSTTCGTNPDQMTDWLNRNGFTATWKEGGTLELIRENLDAQRPVLVEWSDWGGHWVVAIGYDTRNTTNPMDDVIIFADPYDHHDDNPDGFDTFNAQRFYYMWYDALLFGKVMRRIYILAIPLMPAE